MKKYDAIVIGSGCGSSIVEAALDHDWKVALVDRGPLGGTCMNVGCVPSKMVIYTADRIIEIRETERLGISARIDKIDFNFIMERMRKLRQESREYVRDGVSHGKNLDYFEGQGKFITDYTLEVNGEQIKADRIVIAAGSRPAIPPVKGLTEVNYLTNETLLELRKRPDAMVIIGGGYIAVEYAHFFEAMGTKVTILEMAERLVLSEEPEIAALLKEELSKRMEVNTGFLVDSVNESNGIFTVTARENKTGQTHEFKADSLLVAAGRRSNADLIQPEKTGVNLDDRGYVAINEYMETSRTHIWAVGDITGKYMFTHVANREAAIVAHNAVHNSRLKMDFTAIPHAIFSYPQVASVGMLEGEARKDHSILVGTARYLDTARGEAMGETRGFAKAIVDKETQKILGFHIIGPEAPTVIQEVVNAMASGGNIPQISAGLHIHPAMSELIDRVFDNLEEVTD